jgi:hypothetical protein
MRIGFILATALTLVLAACTGNSQNGSQNSPAPTESTNAMGAMATAASNAGHAAAGAAGAVATKAANAAGAMAKTAAGAAGSVAQMAPHSLSYALKAQNGSGENGKVTLVGTGSKTTVTISLTGENTTGKQPAHIHTGPCSKLGAVKYPLSDVVLGKSVTVVSAPLDTLTNGTLAVNVHESAADIAKYVSCGDLTKMNMK